MASGTVTLATFTWPLLSDGGEKTARCQRPVRDISLVHKGGNARSGEIWGLPPHCAQCPVPWGWPSGAGPDGVQGC